MLVGSAEETGRHKGGRSEKGGVALRLGKFLGRATPFPENLMNRRRERCKKVEVTVVQGISGQEQKPGRERESIGS